MQLWQNPSAELMQNYAELCRHMQKKQKNRKKAKKQKKQQKPA